MYRWCAYCWKLMGERAPFADLCSTHGICEECVAADAPFDDDIVAKTLPIKQLHTRLRQMATTGRIDDVHELIRAWEHLGLGRIELLVAVLQPALYVVGRAWELGQASPSVETEVTSFCNAILQVLDANQRERVSVTEGPPIFLLSSGGNTHDIGIKMLAYALREARRDVRVLPKPPPPEHLRMLCEVVQPSAVGVSVALATHASYVVEIVDACATLLRPPRIVVGGVALAVLPASVVRWSSAESLLGAAAFFAALEDDLARTTSTA